MKRKAGLPVAPMACAVIALLTVLPSTAEACLEEEFSFSIDPVNYIALTVIFSLVIMGICAIAMITERFVTYRSLRKQSREFASEIYMVWFYNRAVNLSAWDQKSPLAAVLQAVRQDVEVVRAAGIRTADFCETARRRAVSLKYMEFKKGLWTLEAIACVAPIVGVLGTLAEIARCLYGMAVAGGNSLLARASNMADAVWLTVFALAVAAPAVVMSKYFSSTVETLTAELEVSSANLVYRFLNQEQANQMMGTHPDAQAANAEVMTKSPSFLLFS